MRDDLRGTNTTDTLSRNRSTSRKSDHLMRRLVLFIAAACVAFTPAIAAAARSSAPTGNDISYPQCAKSYPLGQAFAIVGVNGGKASTFNPCFASQWAWAQTSTGATTQAPAQLYLNTGNPGDVLAQYNVTDWPTSSVPADPYGTCSGTWTDDLPCSWEYGYERATADIGFVGSSTGKWWLDIETGNSWTSDNAKNQASLEGMVYALRQGGATVGIYSSSGSWSSLFGTVATSSPLYTLHEWRPGAKTLAKAQSNCSLAPFEGNGIVEITQYVSSDLDYDHSCI
jgi:hypothetical protein